MARTLWSVNGDPYDAAGPDDASVDAPVDKRLDAPHSLSNKGSTNVTL